MLQPKRVKYRRPHGIKYEGLSKGGNEVSFGEFGLQVLQRVLKPESASMAL